MEDCDEDCVDDMIDIFEEFVKKSLFLVSITAGAIVIMVVYLLKVFNDRAGTRVISQGMSPLMQMEHDTQMLSARPLSPRTQTSPSRRSSLAKLRSSVTQMPPDTQMLRPASSMSPASQSSSSQYSPVKPYGNVTQLAPPGYKSPATSAPSQQTRLVSNKRIQYDISPHSSRSSVDNTRSRPTDAVTQYPDDILLNVKPAESEYLPKSYFTNPALRQNIDELSPRSSYVSATKLKEESPTINDSNDSQNKPTENVSDNVSGSQTKSTDNNLDKTYMKSPDNYSNDSKKIVTGNYADESKMNSTFNNSNYFKMNHSDDRALLNSPAEQSNQNVRINIVLENTEHGLEPKVTCNKLKMINSLKGSNQDQSSDKKFIYPSNDQQHQKIHINIKLETPELLDDETSNMRLLNAIYRDPAIENADSLKTKSSHYSARCEAVKAEPDGKLEGNHSASNETMNAVHSYDDKSSSHSTPPPQNKPGASGKSRNTQTVEFLPMHYSMMGRGSSKRYSNPNFRTCSITDCYHPCTRSQSFTYFPQQRGSCCSICCEHVY